VQKQSCKSNSRWGYLTAWWSVMGKNILGSFWLAWACTMMVVEQLSVAGCVSS